MPLVLLDKNFLQGEARSAPRLRMLVDAGYTLVLSDPMAYELADAAPAQWLRAQEMLFDLADHVVTWQHTAELLCQERDIGRPITTPECASHTAYLRERLRQRNPILPSDLIGVTQGLHQQREVDTYDALAGLVRSYHRRWPRELDALRSRAVSGEDLATACSEFVQDPRIIEDYIRTEHGNPADRETYIPSAEHGLAPHWFAYQHARSMLALISVYFAKYGLNNTPGGAFPNTKLDADYVALLYYADAIATNETSGDLGAMLRATYDDSKYYIALGDVPRPHDIEVAAYFRWLTEGCTHGHDVDDWLSAKHGILCAFRQGFGLQGTDTARQSAELALNVP